MTISNQYAERAIRRLLDAGIQLNPPVAVRAGGYVVWIEGNPKDYKVLCIQRLPLRERVRLWLKDRAARRERRK